MIARTVPVIPVIHNNTEISELYKQKTKFMKHLTTLFLTFMCVGIFMACTDNDDTNESVSNSQICQVWQLVGYTSEGGLHLLAEDLRTKSEQYGYRFYLVFNNDGTWFGRQSGNELAGNYSTAGSQISVKIVLATLAGELVGGDESEAFTTRLSKSSSYAIEDGNKLRIYYAPDEFLYFEAITSVSPGDLNNGFFLEDKVILP